MESYVGESCEKSQEYFFVLYCGVIFGSNSKTYEF